MDDKDIKSEISDSYRKLSGCFLELSEGFFRENVSKEKWTGFRKLVLDLVNGESRYISARIDGKYYYNFKIGSKKEGN